MNFKDKIRQITADTVRNQINLVATLRFQQNVQNIIGVVSTIDGKDTTVTFPDGSQTVGIISTSRPISIGSYVIVVGGNIL